MSLQTEADGVQGDVADISRLASVDTILRLLLKWTGLRVAVVARVTAESWTACAIVDEVGSGLVRGEPLELITTFCNTVSGAAAPLLITSAAEDLRFRDRPGRTQYGIESYIAVPLNRRDGRFFGTLCALDLLPAPHLSERDFAIFEMLAALIAFELEEQDNEDLRRTIAAGLVEKLMEAQQQAEERERMMGILSHDLRTPLASIRLSAEVMMSKAPEDMAALARKMFFSTMRMTRLVTDLLDFTRTRFIGGIPLNRVRSIDMRAVCEKVLHELQVARPDRTIQLSASGESRGDWDGDRLAQVVSNLVSNAIDHGDPGTAIEVILSGDHDIARLEVTSSAADLSESTMKSLFQPFHPGSSSTNRSRGLGLGLFIVRQILHAHGGEVSVSSSGGRVQFETIWPRKAMTPATMGSDRT